MPSSSAAERRAAARAPVAALFDSEAANYDRAHEGPRGHLLQARMTAALEAIGPGPGTVLDAGMGPGRLLEQLGARGWTASGVDLSERMVQLAGQRVPGARERLRQGSIDDLPFGSGSFDAAVALGVVEYLADPAAAVAELARVLRPGGVLVVSMPNVASARHRLRSALWLPLVRKTKTLVPALSRPAPYAKPGLRSRADLERIVLDAGAQPITVRHLGLTVLPARLGAAAPAVERRLAGRLEESGAPVVRALSAQLVLCARRI